MESILAGLTEPFVRMTPDEASTLLREQYDIEATALDRLETERDDTFRVTTEGASVVLKVAHPGDDPALIDLQLAAMNHVAATDPQLPLQRVIPTRGGRFVTTTVPRPRDEHDTTAPQHDLAAPPRTTAPQLATPPHLDAPTEQSGARITRVLSWLDGDLLTEVDATGEQRVALGVALGQLSLALREFEHPAAHRELAWDLARLPRLRDYSRDDLTLGVIDNFENHVSPVLARLPQQVIHNDFHPGNVIVSPDPPAFVTGILDFGDTVFSARICDLGVALGYFVPEEGPVWPVLQPIIDGYDSVVRLLDEERTLIPHLTAARLVQRIIINAAHSAPRTDQAHSTEHSARALRNLLSEG